MNNNITLQQGIDRFHKNNMKYFSERSTSKEGKEFLRCHDVAHIVFGCDTSIYGEGTVKIWTTFEYTLVLSLLFNVLPISLPESYRLYYVVLLVLMGLFLSVNMRWVAYLNFKFNPAFTSMMAPV